MSYIESINQAATASTETSSSKTINDGILGKQDFLTLLVAQLQNQDPLNPEDPTEFTAQLAQFSSLEQLFNLNDSMNTLSTSVTDSSKTAALDTMGKDVVFEGGHLNYNGEPVEVGYMLDGYAANVQMVIQQNGATVRILEGESLTEGSHFLSWDGLNESGQEMPAGDYKVVIQVQAREGESIAASPLIKSEVTGVDLSGTGGSTLITRAGEVGFTSIFGVYDKNVNLTQ